MNLTRFFTLVFCFTSLFPSYSFGAEKEDLQTEVRQWREANEQSIVDGFVDLLKIPNVASDTINILRNADHLVSQFEARGFSTSLLESDGPPAVFAEKVIPGADRTILVYIHYDGQPANADDWASDPWT
ncbi:MAG TPA: hypothetical protein VJ984_09900, partial [Xanthomonadales bacterium]|nr:hypothetical protein [Xanthomonadales bacterium]